MSGYITISRIDYVPAFNLGQTLLWTLNQPEDPGISTYYYACSLKRRAESEVSSTER